MIVAPEGSTNQEENGGNGNKQITAEESGETGFAVGLRSMIALHVVLVDTVILQIGENTINETHPKRTLTKCGERERTERELISVPRHPQRFNGAFGMGEQQDTKAYKRTPNHDESLNGIGPDHALHTAQHRISDDGKTGQDDDPADIPSQQKIHRKCKQINNRADAGNLREQVTG